MAFEPGHGRTAVPVRSALAETTMAIAAIVAALVFGTSLIALVSTPHRYGQNWDQQLDLGFQGASAAFGAKVLAAEPAIAGYAAGNYGQLTINGHAVAATGISPHRGAGFFTLLAGRPPSGPGLRSSSAPRPCAPSTAGSGKPCRLWSTLWTGRWRTLTHSSPCASLA